MKIYLCIYIAKLMDGIKILKKRSNENALVFAVWTEAVESTVRSNSLGVLRMGLSTGTEVVLVLEEDVVGFWSRKA